MTNINAKHYVTEFGYQQLTAELNQLLREERPKIVEIVRWAAGNGDRSENGDYIYGKKRLREIDRRIRYLTKRIENAVIISQQQQQHLKQVFFGATVLYQDEEGLERQVQIVGLDEANIGQNKISYISPFAKAILKANIDDEVTIPTPEGPKSIVIIDIGYM